MVSRSAMDSAVGSGGGLTERVRGKEKSELVRKNTGVKCEEHEWQCWGRDSKGRRMRSSERGEGGGREGPGRLLALLLSQY